MFNINPKKIQAVMKQLGMKQEDIDAERVIIEGTNKRIIIENPSVVKIEMQGQETFQISGDVKEETVEEPESQEDIEKDIQLIIEKTNCTEQEAKEVLERNNGDIAATILELSK